MEFNDQELAAGAAFHSGDEDNHDDVADQQDYADHHSGEANGDDDNDVGAVDNDNAESSNEVVADESYSNQSTSDNISQDRDDNDVDKDDDDELLSRRAAIAAELECMDSEEEEQEGSNEGPESPSSANNDDPRSPEMNENSKNSFEGENSRNSFVNETDGPVYQASPEYMGPTSPADMSNPQSPEYTGPTSPADMSNPGSSEYYRESLARNVEASPYNVENIAGGGYSPSYDLSRQVGEPESPVGEGNFQSPPNDSYYASSEFEPHHDSAFDGPRSPGAEEERFDDDAPQSPDQTLGDNEQGTEGQYDQEGPQSPDDGANNIYAAAESPSGLSDKDLDVSKGPSENDIPQSPEGQETLGGPRSPDDQIGFSSTLSPEYQQGGPQSPDNHERGPQSPEFEEGFGGPTSPGSQEGFAAQRGPDIEEGGPQSLDDLGPRSPEAPPSPEGEGKTHSAPASPENITLEKDSRRVVISTEQDLRSVDGLESSQLHGPRSPDGDDIIQQDDNQVDDGILSPIGSPLAEQDHDDAHDDGIKSPTDEANLQGSPIERPPASPVGSAVHSRSASPLGSRAGSPLGSPQHENLDKGELSDADSDIIGVKRKPAVKDSDDEDDESDKGSAVGELIADIFGPSDEEEEFEGFGADADAQKRKDQKSTEEGGESKGGIAGDDSSDEELDRGRGFEGGMSDFEKMLIKKKEETQRRRKKRKDVDIINDNDDLIDDLIKRMKEAADEDRQFNESKKPAVRKLKMLPEVMQQLKKADLHPAFLDGGILTAMTEWLAPLPDKSLPHLQIREFMLKQLMQFPSISTEGLKLSGIGKAVMYLGKHPKEIRTNKDIAKKLINEWSRPIFNLTSNYKNLSREEREQRDYEQLPKKRRISLEGGSSGSQDIDRALAGSEKVLRPGDPGYVYRARVPMPSTKDYVIRPKWTVDEKPKSSKKTLTRYEKCSRSFADKKRKSSYQASKISIEGRNMSL